MRLPGLQVFDATQHVQVTGRVLLDHIHHVIWSQALFEFPLGHQKLHNAERGKKKNNSHAKKQQVENKWTKQPPNRAIERNDMGSEWLTGLWDVDWGSGPVPPGDQGGGFPLSGRGLQGVFHLQQNHTHTQCLPDNVYLGVWLGMICQILEPQNHEEHCGLQPGCKTAGLWWERGSLTNQSAGALWFWRRCLSLCWVAEGVWDTRLFYWVVLLSVLPYCQPYDGFIVRNCWTCLGWWCGSLH